MTEVFHVAAMATSELSADRRSEWSARTPTREAAAIESFVSGHCAPDLIGVRDAFTQNFLERGEVGAAICVIRHGEVVVDLCGGWADPDHTQRWTPDTLVNFYSAGKAIVATLVLRLVQRGLFTLDTPVADIWPEFAAGGKHVVTVRQAMCHEAAVPAIREALTDADLLDWSTMTGALAATEPWWPIGTRHAYHTNTFGHLLGELVRRTTGSLPGIELDRLAGEIGADVWIGVPEEHLDRCADVIWAQDNPVDLGTIDLATLGDDQRMNVLAHFNPPGYSSVGLVNSVQWRTAQVPSTNGHGSARGLARFYAALLEPERVLSVELLGQAAAVQSVGPCSILGDDVSFGLGFTPTTPRRPLGPNPGSFGHFGTGGALGFADPVSGIAFGYVMNHVIPRWQSTRNRALIDRLYAGTTS
jgi:CubicO group peptidase (beta-lactamase class C family)